MRTRASGVLAWTALVLNLAGFGGPGVVAMPAARADEHAAEHSGKWATDETLRKGMSALREIANSPQPDPGRMDAELGNIFRNCKLPAAADHALHPILEKIIAAKKTLAAKPAESQRRAAVARIQAALREYGQHFDHPGWSGEPSRPINK